MKEARKLGLTEEFMPEVEEIADALGVREGSIGRDRADGGPDPGGLRGPHGGNCRA